MKAENELSDLINEKFRIENEGNDSDFFVDEILSDTALCLNVHVTVLRWMNENIEPHRIMFENICKYLFDIEPLLVCITSPFGDNYRKL